MVAYINVAFSTEDYFYPLITGKDIGCGVMYLKISKSDWLNPFNKDEHYRAFNFAHIKMTDDGLGGGNHFLSLEVHIPLKVSHPFRLKVSH